MTKLIRFITVLILLSSCASYHVRQGNRLYKDLAYSQAIQEYQKGLSKKEFPQARIALAESYRKMNDLAHAEEAYAKVVTLKEAEPVHYLRYAELLMRRGKYDQAKSYFDQYLSKVPSDVEVSKLRSSCDSIQKWKADSIRYTVQSSPLNTGQSNFSPVYYKEGIVFTSDRNTKSKTYAWTGRPFLEMYYAKGSTEKGFSTPTSLQGVDGSYHDGPSCFSSKGDTMYFTRNNYVKRKVHKSVQELVNLKVCEAIRKDSSWTQVKDVSFNSDEYSCGHPTLSSDGTQMYFISDMPGGVGGTDVYRSRKANGVWSKPENLGTSINTTYNEMFPTLWHDSVLYYSSEGHYNFGGLDIFRSVNTGSGWSASENVGYPVNTNYDDFGMAMDEKGEAGFFSSNRNESNTTQDNIYSFVVTDLRFTLQGIAVEKQSQEPIQGVMVELTNKKTGKKEEAQTTEDGTFKFKLDQNTDYSIVGSKDTYFTNTEQLSTVGKNRSEDMYVKLKLELEKIVINKPIVLENIYYDLDKYAIRADAAEGLNKLVSIMQDNPGIKIELSSHTDSRAEDKYNDVLSQKRAEAAVGYIISKGISKDRIVAKGYGERQLVNRCTNGVKCSEEEHQANRRTEFKVVSIQK